jgi:hypothetical protein
MAPVFIREWLRPILGAALLLAGAAGLAYKVIGGYRHAAPEAFVSVRDQNKPPAASAAAHPIEAATAVATSPQSTAKAAQATPLTSAGPIGRSGTAPGASSAAADVEPQAEAPDDSACAANKIEQREIQSALKKQYSPEEGRYMQRRLRELAEQLINLECAK